jgi:phage repressor protein C with HTH and peptisase S24 domain/DNA-binding XRE family transcriptional regulator
MAKTRVAPNPNVGKNISALMDGSLNLGTQQALARKTKIGQTTIGRIIRGESAPSAEYLRAIAEAYSVDVDSLYMPPDAFHKAWRAGKLSRVGDRAAIAVSGNPDYPAIRRVHFKLSAGASGFAVEYLDEEDAPIVFRREWFTSHGYQPTKLFAVKVANGSMEPGLWDGDTVVVNTADAEPQDGHVFAVNFEGELVIKRLVRDEGRWWLKSDNPDQSRYPRKACGEGVHIIGRIVHKQSEHI